MWSTSVAGVIAFAGVGLFVLTLFVLVLLAAMTRRKLTERADLPDCTQAALVRDAHSGH